MDSKGEGLTGYFLIHLLSVNGLNQAKESFHKTIPFFFCLASNAFPDIGSVGWIEKKTKKKKSEEVSE